jgi:hypothetical protein
MRQFYTLFFVFTLATVSGTLHGQISFTDQTALLQNPNFTSGVALAIADMNGDGLDDIVRLNETKMLSIEYQAAAGQPFANYTFGNVYTGNEGAWAIAVGDVNNDGFCDIFTGGRYNGVKVLTATGNGATYLPQTMPGPSIFTQGANFADINNDGWLDVFSCHDDGESRIWANNGAGGFVEADDWIDMATVPASDNSGNYGSIWTDFDNDGDLDLYIAKCRIGVDDPNDPRRINALFVNDGQNNFTEAAAEYGLKIKWQSWTADFNDIDNDGDLDCLVTNHDYNLQLLENDGSGHFTDISEAAGIAISGGYIQGIMRDFDNDGFIDIVTAAPAYLFHNNGDRTFTQMPSPFGTANLRSLSAGDLNHDGFIDLYAAYQCNYNTPCGVPDKIWMNSGNSNHFLGVKLQGAQSNRMGIGARLEIHGSWGVQVREVRSGESYGIMNSLTQHFGLGQDSIVEYLVVRWPSGQVDVVKNPAVNQFLTVEEGSTCSLAGFEVEVDGLPVICDSGSVTLAAPAGYEYLWSNGAVSQTITVSEAGNFSLLIVDSLGCTAASSVVVVLKNPDETPALAIDGETEFCEGGSVTLSSSQAAGYAWSNGETTQSVAITETGDYFVTIPGACSDFSSEIIHVEVFDTPEIPHADDVTIQDTAAVTLEAPGNHIFWYDSLDATVPIAEGNTFLTPEITETTTFYLEDVGEFGGGNFETGMKQHQGSPFNGNNSNGQLIFDVEQTFILKQVTVITDSAGVRIIELRDTDGNVLQNFSADLSPGATVLDLNFQIEPGAGYILATNTANNQAVLGTQSPRLRRSDSGVQYPYEVPDVVTITGSSFGSGFYYYFFDWKIEIEPVRCTSERSAVTVFYEPVAVKEAKPFGNLTVFPNPSSGLFNLQMEAIESGPASVSISDLTGRVVFGEKFEAMAGVAQHRELDLSAVPSGMYFMKISSGERAGWVKLAVE